MEDIEKDKLTESIFRDRDVHEATREASSLPNDARALCGLSSTFHDSAVYLHREMGEVRGSLRHVKSRVHQLDGTLNRVVLWTTALGGGLIVASFITAQLVMRPVAEHEYQIKALAADVVRLRAAIAEEKNKHSGEYSQTDESAVASDNVR